MRNHLFLLGMIKWFVQSEKLNLKKTMKEICTLRALTPEPCIVPLSQSRLKTRLYSSKRS